LDVPYIARKTRATIIGTESAANVMRASGVPPAQVLPVKGGEDLRLGTISIRVIPSLHGGIAGREYPDAPPIPRTVQPPFKFDDLAEGGSLAYLIRIGGHSILTFGSANYIEREIEGLRPDVVLVGALGRESIHDYMGRLMRALGNPPLVLPTHWDDFFLPFDASQAPYRQRLQAFIAEVHDASPKTRVIVPEYFKPVLLSGPAR
jgi:L-ascorbate metabolism protein UlaG (beta-lactamase superfamily)